MRTLGWIASAIIGLPGCADDAPRRPPPPVQAAESSAEDPGWLREVTGRAGIDFVHDAGGTGRLLLPEVMGGGVAFLDWNGDGRDDLYFVNGGADSAAPEERGAARNRLYENRGDGRFAEVPGAGGAPGETYGMGVAVGDVDGDGRPDLYLTTTGEDELHLRRDEGFARAEGAVASGWSSSAAFLDHDADGDLDLFVVRYVQFDPDKRCYEEADRPEYCGPLEFPPLADVLLVNEDGCRLADRSAAAGIADLAAAGLGVACDDFDDDGRVDVYVANDASANHLWRNLGGGAFTESALLSGAAYNLHGIPEAGMGVVAADLDEDGAVDLFMTHLMQESNTLYRNLGGARGFVDDTGRSGLAQASVPSTGFGVVAFDVELDGDTDLFVANGRVRRGDVHAGPLAPPWDRYADPNQLFLNDGTGVFVCGDAQAGDPCGPAEITRGAALGDLDGDGDLDLAVVNANGPARLYRNDALRVGTPLVLDVRDGERPAVGAVVRIRAAGTVRRRSVSANVGYLSSSRPQIHVALPPAASGPVAVEVRWADRAEERFEVVAGSTVAVLRRGAGRRIP